MHPGQLTLADATKRLGTDRTFVRSLLVRPQSWMTLLNDEVWPVPMLDASGWVITWSSPWPKAPNDTILLELSGPPHNCQLRFQWFTDDPPDPRGIGKVRFRLNYLFGSEIRGPISAYNWGDWDPPTGAA